MTWKPESRDQAFKLPTFKFLEVSSLGKPATSPAFSVWSNSDKQQCVNNPTFILRTLVFQMSNFWGSCNHCVNFCIYNKSTWPFCQRPLFDVWSISIMSGHCASCSKTGKARSQVPKAIQAHNFLSTDTGSTVLFTLPYVDHRGIYFPSTWCSDGYTCIMTDLFQGSLTSIPWSAQWVSQQPQQRGTLQFPIHSPHSSVSNPFFQELESWLLKSTPFQRTRLPLMHHHHTIR